MPRTTQNELRSQRQKKLMCYKYMFVSSETNLSEEAEGTHKRACYETISYTYPVSVLFCNKQQIATSFLDPCVC
jgi:hypothetical protein